MGSYVDQSLTRNESVISRAQTSWIPTIIPVIIGILLLPFYGLGLLIIIPVLLRVWSTELALTNQRVIAKVGFIRRNTVELRIDKVESLGIHQGILGRIFNYGSIVIKGTGGTNTPIPNIKAPMQFRSIVNNHIEEMNSKQQQLPRSITKKALRGFFCTCQSAGFTITSVARTASEALRAFLTGNRQNRQQTTRKPARNAQALFLRHA